ncbi:MAG: hydrogenase maturation protease [candidate division KSB1 bacterium]|nr:hydrogenase maturation protease [candidate division KSB1 bacterium]MDZ7369276.1 hydrogenase maturation protease [candidate division KSB1 bacterium]MDZ7407311.1 hydrogenase maturation protease [candidate division KSB1 bacterium]
MSEGVHPLVIGLGNEYRRDDAAGLIVARRLRERVPNEINIIEQSGEGAVLMEAWKKARRVIIIDAVHSGAAPGSIFRFEAHAQPLPTKFFHYSTHAFSVAEAIELARALKQLPSCLIVYGIEGKNFAAGVGLSAEVEKSTREVVERIRQEFV